ncbi:hypothetical protein HN51_004732 [Arachis hypogaea]|uniref:RING-type E3 ubiquitin transferase n=2 Tax=Arachis TaxID=3817 RepID=A0A445DHB8_ARAHY|nr:BOI-related E3 ubiquitin-protein ligase 1 [Arachis duranensis]XP_025695011.1 BOI-related E3 ubiquitin-protein ligase 1 [Arachis hypogaea]XP_057757624.1 BOI-related E3 ubiquitin-protein ligase 1-like [Arachis stenosperma]QHO38364.1 BOI-related E3 ubiquitin-protein ligase [Arachis hypogaea]RYR62569.1 hypothetical protein Ahy_A04g020256 [Arachis hypogaea]
MAVEAPHNLFPPQQFLSNTEFMKLSHNQYQQHNMMMDAGIITMNNNNNTASTTTMPESLLMPLYASCDPNSINKSDSGLTYHHRISLPRKRSREDSIAESSNVLPLPQKSKLSSPFLHHHNNLLLHHLNNQHSEIDQLISQHTERVRLELEEQRTRQSRTFLTAIQEAVITKLKEKDDEIQRMGKLNFALQERVKSLCLENQLWRDLAQTNEATANSLRSNLEQVLAHVATDDNHQHHNNNNGYGYDDEAESSCASNNRHLRLEDDADDGGDSGAAAVRMCKKCGERESIVLLLPCRHLCLCTACGSTVRNCPLCNSGINASVHVNLS